MESTDNFEKELEFYKQGSESCRNYSRLTMQTRTLSQQVLVIGVVGVIAAVAASKESAGVSASYIFGGIALAAFSISLYIVDWHYQSAFSAIRDQLAKAEFNSDFHPWTAHLEVRKHWKDHLASFVPFFILFTVGMSISTYGLTLQSQLSCAWLVVAIITWLIFSYIGVVHWHSAVVRAKKHFGALNANSAGIKQ